MIGDKHCLDVYMGNEIIAQLQLKDDQLHWSYTNSWQQSGYAISPHLPLHGALPPLNVQRFLRNLLPEGKGLDELIHTFHLSKDNTFGLIRALGDDMPGALTVYAANKSPPQKANFRKINDNELEQRLDARREISLIIWDNKPRLSVAGIQDKINVIVTQNHQLGFGEGKLCSTHILKFERQNQFHLVLNEYITMMLAKNCGLTVANVAMKYYGKHPALLVERFDRQWIKPNQVKRRHIIDGCQALNLPPDYKYEQNFGHTRDVAHIRDGASLPKLFAFCDLCINPVKTKLQLLDWVLFNILIFNYDAHGKNISFYVGAKGISLAPFYDLVNIKLFLEFEQSMAMALGDEFDGNSIHAYQLADFADSCHLKRTLVTERLQLLLDKILKALAISYRALIGKPQDRMYIEQYQQVVLQRCEYLTTQLDLIKSIEL